MAKGHLLSGALAGVSTLPVLGVEKGPVLVGAWVLAWTYGGLVPDLDMTGARLTRIGLPPTWLLSRLLLAVVRFLRRYCGPVGQLLSVPVEMVAEVVFKAGVAVTFTLSRFLVWLSIEVYRATRTPMDKPDHDGHRGLTHTVVFCLVFGSALFALLVAVRVPVELAFVIAAGTGGGSLAHLAGDCCTMSACPLWWPVVLPWSGGRRWYRAGIPVVLRFKTGGARDDEEATPWQAAGERVVTFGLAVATGLVAFGYVPGGYDWVFDGIGRLSGWSTGWIVVI